MNVGARLRLGGRDVALYGVIMFVLVPAESLAFGAEASPWRIAGAALALIAAVTFTVTYRRRKRAARAEAEVWRTKHSPAWRPGDDW